MVMASLTRQPAPHEEPFCLPHRHLPKQTGNRAARRPMELKKSPLQGCTESAPEPIKVQRDTNSFPSPRSMSDRGPSAANSVEYSLRSVLQSDLIRANGA